jgi:hypothetical protein
MEAIGNKLTLFNEERALKKGWYGKVKKVR